ncbi:MAG TPA: hypothetical protein VD970_03790 [Acetobacteraceae bacterium]|nr:hypothetical protein [Acetobacteraceae bacterium]
MLGWAFDVLLANIVPLTVLAALLAGAPAFLVEYWRLAGTAVLPPGGLPFTIGSFVIQLALAAMLQVTGLRLVIRQIDGGPRELGADIAAGFALFVPVTILMMMVAIAVAIGLIVLIVPGLIFYVMYSVAVPAYVEERPGLFGAMRRSQELTERVRWRLFVLLFLYWAFAIGLLLLGDQAGIELAGELGSPALAMGLVFAVHDTIASVTFVPLIAAIYVALRNREGGQADHMAEVFA